MSYPFTVVLDGHIDDFTDLVETLKAKPARRTVAAARRLCALSREITFDLGPPSDHPEDSVKDIIKLFRDAVSLLDPAAGGAASPFLTRIRERATALEALVPVG